MPLWVEASGRLILGCGQCGERLVLLGREDDWLAENRETFPCGGCGRQLRLGARIVPSAADDAPAGR